MICDCTLIFNSSFRISLYLYLTVDVLSLVKFFSHVRNHQSNSSWPWRSESSSGLGVVNSALLIPVSLEHQFAQLTTGILGTLKPWLRSIPFLSAVS
jgi:hypothetical protein